MERVVIGIAVLCFAAMGAILVAVVVSGDGKICPDGQTYQVVTYATQTVNKVTTIQPVYACK